jgi:long-chain alkane monooxygenase
MHLAWFIGMGCSVQGWNQPWSGLVGSEWMNPDIYLDLVRALDRACFDYVVIEDGSFVPDAFRGSSEWYLRNASTVPKSDPMPLVPLLAQASRRLGIVATMTTAFYPPYLAARLGATLDHLTHGRVGLNLVTAHNDRSAQNFGPNATMSTIYGTRWRMNGSMWSTASGRPGSRERSSPTAKPAFSPITRKSTQSTSKAGITNAADR